LLQIRRAVSLHGQNTALPAVTSRRRVAVTGICLTPWLVPNDQNRVQPGALAHRPEACVFAWNRRAGRLHRTFNAVVAGSSPARLTIIFNRLKRKTGAKHD
jgi:hypothetical protein